VLERPALEKLHGDEVLACVLVNVVDSADIGMVQSRSRLSIAYWVPRPREEIRILKDFRIRESWRA
jgi:hypothetical protein